MEGAEFLVHEQMMIGTKQQPRILVTEADVVERAPLTLTPDERRTLNQPEQEPPQAIGEGDSSGKEGV